MDLTRKASAARSNLGQAGMWMWAFEDALEHVASMAEVRCKAFKRLQNIHKQSRSACAGYLRLQRPSDSPADSVASMLQEAL